MEADEKALEAASEAARSSGNRSRKARLLTLHDLDKRTNACRAALELRDNLVSDLGGSSEVSTAQTELCQRASVISALIGNIEAQCLQGGSVDASQYVLLVNCQRRVLSDLGLERKAKDVTNLATYLTARAAAAPAPDVGLVGAAPTNEVARSAAVSAALPLAAAPERGAPPRSVGKSDSYIGPHALQPQNPKTQESESQTESESESPNLGGSE